jgi:hypothetical protein
MCSGGILYFPSQANLFLFPFVFRAMEVVREEQLARPSQQQQQLAIDHGSSGSLR